VRSGDEQKNYSKRIIFLKRAVDGNDSYFRHWLDKSLKENVDYVKKITEAKFREDELTILHVASKHCQYSVIKILIEHYKMGKNICKFIMRTSINILKVIHPIQPSIHLFLSLN